MKIRVSELRRLVREAAGGLPHRSVPFDGSVGPVVDREQLGSLGDYDIDTDDDADVSAHLREPAVDAADCFGPVPPTGEDPYATPDPFARDVFPH